MVKFLKKIRLTPVYMMMVAILDVNQTKYSRTSVFNTTERADVTCGKYWWRNLLYINNIYSRDDMVLYFCKKIKLNVKFFISSVCLGVGILQMTCSSL